MINRLVERYHALREAVGPRLDAFARGERPFLVVQEAPLDVYTNCNTIDAVYQENLRFFSRQMEVATDSLPYLEPWMGTGIYANAFGCAYVWREDESPAVHYRYHSLDDITDLPPARIDDSPMMARVLETITCFRERTGDALPIALTDTQSAHDTATLVLDACELFAGCYEQPALVHRFLAAINQLIIDFSRRQIEVIGAAPVARPGHIMVSAPHWAGIAVSDDNLAVCSTEIGQEFALPYDQQLADAFGGVAIHSCGRWQHQMPDLARMRQLVQVDCAIHRDSDPNPNDPEAVREAFAGTSIPVKVRGPLTSIADWTDLLPRLLHPDLRVIVQLGYPGDAAQAAANYHHVTRQLQAYFGG